MERKAIPVTDNTFSYHKKEQVKIGEIKVIFLPQIVISLCQPTVQGVTETPKKTYWCRLLHSSTEGRVSV